MIDSPTGIPGPKPAWVKPFARMGYGARGLVYLVLAMLMIYTAFLGGENPATRDAIRLLSREVAGGAVALVLIAGLGAYSLWRLTQAVFDTDDHGWKPTGLAVRLGLLASCVTYALLAAFTISLWRGSGEGGGDGEFARLFSQTVGARPAAIALATVFVGVGAAHLWKAARRKHRAHIAAPAGVMRAIDAVAIAGLAARGLIFLLLGLLFYRRGATAGEGGGTPGLKEALDYIQSLPAGSWLLGAVGAGFVAFAAYSFAEARWRRINVEDV